MRTLHYHLHVLTKKYSLNADALLCIRIFVIIYNLLKIIILTKSKKMVKLYMQKGVVGAVFLMALSVIVNTNKYVPVSDLF